MELMATFSAPSPSSYRYHNFPTHSNSKCFNSDSIQPLIFSPFHPHCPSLRLRLRLNSYTRPPRCLSAGPGPPSPPDSDPSRPPAPGFAGKLSTFQDRVQIFFAVLFWMSLFFWASAWDRKNSGRPNKGSRFRR